GSCALTSCAVRSEASAHTRTAMDVSARRVRRITVGLLSWANIGFTNEGRVSVISTRIARALSAARPAKQPLAPRNRRRKRDQSRLSRQRSIDHAEEVSDRTLIHTEPGVVVGGRLQGDDFLLALATSLELGDALARLGEHGPVVAQHRLGAGWTVAGHDP